MTDIEKLTADDFDKLLFKTFHVLRPKHDVPQEDTVGGSAKSNECQEPGLELIEVDRLHRLRKLEGKCSERKRDPFTLLFRGSHENVFTSHIHTLAHGEFGAIDVYINAVHIDPVQDIETHPQGRFYEVYFN